MVVLFIGVIESPETLKSIATTYTKAVVWYLLKFSFNRDNVNRRLEMAKKKKNEGKYEFVQFALYFYCHIFIYKAFD